MSARIDYLAATIKTKTAELARTAYAQIDPRRLDLGNTAALETYNNTGPSISADGSNSSAQNTSSGQQTLVPGETENALNNYRSVTYNVTLAALTPDDVKNPVDYRTKELRYVIAASKGKGSKAISETVTPIVTDIFMDVTRNERAGGRRLREVTTQQLIGQEYDYTGKAVVEGFNNKSAGALDLFIDDIEVDAILKPNTKTGTATATGVKFSVHEPLSINGFIEALHVSAIASGWSGYLNACYLLKIEFLGFPDSDEPVSDPVKIDLTRYIPIKITGAEMSVTESGTVYRCTAVPYNEWAFSNPNQIYTDISFSGRNVKEVLESLFEGINASTVEREFREKQVDASRISDSYEIYFPQAPAPGEPMKLDKTVTSKIGSANIDEFLRNNSIYKFPPVEESPLTSDTQNLNETTRLLGYNPELRNKRYVPTENQIQFSKGSNISEIIEAVIRDSQYLSGIIEDVGGAVKNSPDGMIEYFQIHINVIPKGVDATTNVQKFTYQYIVCPYKVHYSLLPNQDGSKYLASKMAPFTKRTYDYIYAGKNIDVLNFRLHFNNLFFQASTPKMGNSDKSERDNAAAPTLDPAVKMPTDASKDAYLDTGDRVQKMTDNSAGSTAGRGRAYTTDPYFQLAIQTHQAILESVDLITGDLEIIGDPYYLSTVGMGNYLPTVKDGYITLTGEANYKNSPVLVRVNFRNPVDIDSDAGLMSYSMAQTSFSGIYQVLSCRSTLKDGMFKQVLKLMRFKGQILEDENKKETKQIEYELAPNPKDAVTVDRAPADVAKAGVKPNETDLTLMIAKGLPTSGIAGAGANIAADVNQAIAAAKKFTGVVGNVASALNNALGAAAAVLPELGSAVNGTIVNLDSLSKYSTPQLNTAAALSQIGNTAKTLVPGATSEIMSADLSMSVANNISSVETALKNAGIPLSTPANNMMSIGKGFTDGAATYAGNQGTAGLLSSAADNAARVLNAETGELTPQQRAAVIADAKEKGIPEDQALRNASIFGVNLPGVQPSYGTFAKKLGIPNMISGLSGKLDSKVVAQVENLAKEVPENSNLPAAKQQGIIMSNLSGDSLKNLPAIPPQLKALAAKLPDRSVSSALSPEQRAAVIADANAKGIPVDQALRNASIFGINVSGLTPEAQAIARNLNPQATVGTLKDAASLGLGAADITGGKLSAIQKNLNSLSPTPQSVESSIASVQNIMGNPGSNLSGFENFAKNVSAKFGSVAASVGTPLDKLMTNAVNSLNDPNAPPYTGTDPIIRRRLGLPPALDENGNEIT